MCKKKSNSTFILQSSFNVNLVIRSIIEFITLNFNKIISWTYSHNYNSVTHRLTHTHTHKRLFNRRLYETELFTLLYKIYHDTFMVRTTS